MVDVDQASKQAGRQVGLQRFNGFWLSTFFINISKKILSVVQFETSDPAAADLLGLNSFREAFCLVLLLQVKRPSSAESWALSLFFFERTFLTVDQFKVRFKVVLRSLWIGINEQT